MIDNDQPKVAVTVVIIQDEKIIIGKRKNSGLYALPGGHLEKFEDINECATRELKEETGLTVNNFKHFDVLNLIQREKDFHYVTFVVVCQYPSDQVITNLEEHKHDEWIWVDAKQLQQLKLEKLLFNALDELSKKGTPYFFNELQKLQ